MITPLSPFLFRPVVSAAPARCSQAKPTSLGCWGPASMGGSSVVLQSFSGRPACPGKLSLLSVRGSARSCHRGCLGGGIRLARPCLYAPRGLRLTAQGYTCIVMGSGSFDRERGLRGLSASGTCDHAKSHSIKGAPSRRREAAGRLVFCLSRIKQFWHCEYFSSMVKYQRGGVWPVSRSP